MENNGEAVRITDNCQRFLDSILCSPGHSIYEIGKQLGLNYRRSHDHAKSLMKAGLVVGVRKETGRKSVLLFPKKDYCS